MNDFDVLGPDKKPLKIATFDIESLDLSAEWAYMVCACVKEVNRHNLLGKTHTFRIDNYDYEKEQDKSLLKDLVKCLDSFDLILGWYSSRFDFPFTVTRCLKYRLKVPTKNFRRDLCLSARGFGKLNNNRLASWDRWLFGKATKTNLTFERKLGAIRGNKEDIDFYVDHCEKDVFSTERIYKQVMPVLGKLRRG